MPGDEALNLCEEYTVEHKTIYRINDPAGGDGYVQLLAVDGVSYPVTPETRLFIDGQEWAVVRCQIEIMTDDPDPRSVATGTIVTTITVVPNDRT